MTGEKENRKYYQETFKEIHASGELLRKVEAMGTEYNKKPGTRVLRRSCVAAAALAAALISSNMISYAATGSPWIITLTTSDGTELSTEPGIHYLEDGTTYCVKGGAEDENAYMDESLSENGNTETESTTAKSVETQVSMQEDKELSKRSRILQEGQQIFLEVDQVCRIGITENFASASCEGTFEADGKEYYYTVEGTLEAYTIHIFVVE